MEMKAYEVGKRYDEFHNRGEGGKWDMDDTGSQLTITYSNITPKEVENFKTGKLRYKLITINNVIFLLFKFGGEEWMDMPYIVHYSKPFELEEIPDGKGYGCTIILADNATRELKVMRFISFDTRFSRQLKKSIEEQRGFEVDTGNTIMVYNRYSTKQLVDMAIISRSV